MSGRSSWFSIFNFQATAAVGAELRTANVIESTAGVARSWSTAYAPGSWMRVCLCVFVPWVRVVNHHVRCNLAAAPAPRVRPVSS